MFMKPLLGNSRKIFSPFVFVFLMYHFLLCFLFLSLLFPLFPASPITFYFSDFLRGGAHFMQNLSSPTTD